MKKIITHIILCLFFGCSAQNKQITIEKVQQDTLISPTLFSLQINDYNLTESLLGEEKLVINENKLYQYKDSTLVNAEVKIWLHHFPKMNKDSSADCEESPISYGYLKGKIINGKKEGKWLKKISTSESSHDVIVKILHYSNGVLDGKYQIYDTGGKALHPNEPHPLYPDEYKDYSVFKKGTGRYYDYYYDTGILKEEGYYRNGKKYYAWITYDREENEIKRDYYNNGVLVNE